MSKEIQADEKFLEALSVCLTGLNRVFGASAANPENTDMRRDQHKMAQMQVGVFLSSVGLRDIGEQFYFLACALDDLGEGIPHPVLTAKKRKGGRTPDRADVWAVRGLVAIAIDCYRKAGKSEADIAKTITKQKEFAALLRPNTNLKTAPFGWLDQLRDGQVQSILARGRWEQFSTQVQNQNNTSEEWARIAASFLDDAKRHCSQLVKNNPPKNF